MKHITLRLWDATSQSTDNLSIITKLSDLGSPVSYKTLLGFYMNIRERLRHTNLKPAYHVINVYYRDDENSSWNLLYMHSQNVLNPGNRYLEKIFDFPIRGIRNVQLRLSIKALGKFSLNDFGLIYRTHREISTEEHED